MKKLNNKGFSLVELIIVIAIMAILVGVVGTQVIPYLENSRKAKDQQVFSAWNTAAMSAYSNAAAKINSEADYQIVVSQNSGSCKITCTVTNGKPDNNSGAASIEQYFKELTLIEGKDVAGAMESKAGKAFDSATIDITAGGSQVMEISCKDGYHFDSIENK